MKEQDFKLTLQETEQLCRLYLDCRLTVLEETELQYVLGELPYSSPCIDEARMSMGLATAMNVHKKPKRIFGFFRKSNVISIAASFTILLATGILFFLNESMNDEKSTGLYIAYVNGKEMSHEQSVHQVMADMKQAEDFLNHIAELEAQEQSKIDNFINQIPLEQ